MKILSIELSTKVGSIALLEDGQICKEIKWEEHLSLYVIRLRGIREINPYIT